MCNQVGSGVGGPRFSWIQVRDAAPGPTQSLIKDQFGGSEIFLPSQNSHSVEKFSFLDLNQFVKKEMITVDANLNNKQT